MSVLSSNTFLQNLIQTGPDASLNLFAVNFKKYNDVDYDSKLSLRATNFPTPKRNSGTITLPYQNTQIQKISPSTEIDRTVTFNVRIDEQYKVLSSLRTLQVVDKYGLADIDKKYSYTISVDALRPYQSLTTVEQYITAYRWVFYNAFITNVGSMTYDYGSSGTGNVPVTFVYKYYEEYPYDISMENKKFLSSIVGFFSSGDDSLSVKLKDYANLNLSSGTDFKTLATKSKD